MIRNLRSGTVWEGEEEASVKDERHAGERSMALILVVDKVPHERNVTSLNKLLSCALIVPTMQYVCLAAKKEPLLDYNSMR